MEGVSLFISLITLVIGVVLIFAQLRLFSIDNTLKQILAELQRSNAANPGVSSSAAAAQGETAEQMEERRAAIAKIQQNWPGYK